MKVDTFEQAITVIEWYTCRWEIEIFFRTLKSGWKKEKLQLETAERLEPCLALYMIVAWRILFVTMLGRIYPELDCELIFEPEEWQAVHFVLNQTPLPPTPPSISELIPMIAQLGGYLGRKHDSPLGPKSNLDWITANARFCVDFRCYKKCPTIFFSWCTNLCIIPSNSNK